MRTQREFLGLSFDPLDLHEAAQWVEDRAGRPGFAYVVTPNVDHIVRLSKSPSRTLMQAYDRADLRLCDSRVLALLARQSGVYLPVSPGSDLTQYLISKSSSDSRIAVVGGDPAIHRALELQYRYPSWRFFLPPMGVLDDPGARAEIARFVESSGAAIILFAIGAPQSELCCFEIAQRGKARGVALCVGASLEFLTGAKRRAPRWMQRTSLEWLFRLGSEPGRLWRRYLLEGPAIFPLWWNWHRRR